MRKSPTGLTPISEVCAACEKPVQWQIVQEVKSTEGKLDDYKIPVCKKCQIFDAPVKLIFRTQS